MAWALLHACWIVAAFSKWFYLFPAAFTSERVSRKTFRMDLHLGVEYSTKTWIYNTIWRFGWQLLCFGKKCIAQTRNKEISMSFARAHVWKFCGWLFIGSNKNLAEKAKNRNKIVTLQSNFAGRHCPWWIGRFFLTTLLLHFYYTIS